MSRALRGSILRWYQSHRRDLPWRRTRDPYAIWVSEIMLQQTRVETVIPYYKRFLRRFPTVRVLSLAKESDVLALWSGLGYYGRARNLRKAAALVVREHAGRLPESLGALRSLPGIGEYTAAAIASVAFGLPAAAVDGNVIRVLARLHGLRGRRDSTALRRAVAERAEALARGPRPGDWTQALMELGATVCLPRDPLCDLCPASRWCVAKKSAEPDRYPEAATAARPKSEQRVLLVARARGRVLLIPDRADLGATFTLPYAEVRGGALERAARTLARLHAPSDTSPGSPVATFRHRTFSHDLSCVVWVASVGKTPKAGLWVPIGSVPRLPVRSHTLKALNKLQVMTSTTSERRKVV